MARMINIDDLIEAWRKAGMFDPNMFTVKVWDSAWGVQIVDAEPVVRCKDCDHYPYKTTPFLSDRISFKSYRHCWDFPANGYCDLGERQNNGNDKNTD